MSDQKEKEIEIEEISLVKFTRKVRGYMSAWLAY